MFDFENLIHGEKKPFKKQILDCGGNQKKLFGILTLCWDMEGRHYFMRTL